MLPAKVENLDLFLNALSLEKANELKTKHESGNLAREEFEQSLVFRDLPLTEEDKQELANDNYAPVEARLAGLANFNFWKEITMIAIAFLQDEQDKDAFYDAELRVDTKQFKTILFILCVALHHLKKNVLCRPYIDLLKKIVLAYPGANDPPQDALDTIEAQAYMEP